MLASPEDYKWLRDMLIASESLVFYKEYNLGHMGLLFPPNKRSFFDMLELIKTFNPEFKHIPTPELT